MDLERANAICKVAEKLIDSAMVEVKFLEAVDATEVSEFFAQGRPALSQGNSEFEDLRRKRARTA